MAWWGNITGCYSDLWAAVCTLENASIDGVISVDLGYGICIQMSVLQQTSLVLHMHVKSLKSNNQIKNISSQTIKKAKSALPEGHSFFDSLNPHIML